MWDSANPRGLSGLDVPLPQPVIYMLRTFPKTVKLGDMREGRVDRHWADWAKSPPTPRSPHHRHFPSPKSGAAAVTLSLDRFMDHFPQPPMEWTAPNGPL